MAESTPLVEPDPGAPIARDAVDPALIKLKRKRPTIGVITGVGVVLLCGVFLARLNGDRRFADEADQPTTVAVADIVANKVDTHRYIAVDAEPMMSHAIRATKSKGGVGYRVVPVRGTGEKLWLVVHGDGWEPPTIGDYVGRLRELDELPVAEAVEAYATAHPRPVFAAASALRAGFATHRVTTVSGETLTLTDADPIAFDVVDPNAAQIIATINERFPSALAWTAALTAAGITPGTALPLAAGQNDQVRFEVTLPGAVATVQSKLEAAGLWAARVEPITRRYNTSWGALRTSPATGFSVPTATGAGPATVPDHQLDLVGLYVKRSIPDGAYALIMGERPQDYWHVLPITVALILIGLVFAWALVRAVRRDVFPPATTT